MHGTQDHRFLTFYRISLKTRHPTPRYSYSYSPHASNHVPGFIASSLLSLNPNHSFLTGPTTMASKPTSSSTLYFQDMDELHKVFNQFDSNGDGKISVAELGNVLKSMGSSYTTVELERVMDEVDTDKDGFINLQEFAQLCRSSSGAAADSELKEAFDLYDQNKNGQISSAELHQVLNRLGMQCSKEDCERMIGSVDSDGDGCVNFEEFQKMMATTINNETATARAADGVQNDA
ncbi:probable calcium-binding protein CML26 [Manihot esculenta]|uniref:Uncharacterized protein n=2 Tax=Manihot esculenta TaxID=3983 RepID=A0ACB7GIV0_MANES|nr:probable calcium-binding protein CML26 [Manihot esculenta]KAG8639804.1 hypothetical protein MANES_14G170600v8 [Manihot esculenta]